jgi:hypothetical protein
MRVVLGGCKCNVFLVLTLGLFSADAVRSWLKLHTIVCNFSQERRAPLGWHHTVPKHVGAFLVIYEHFNCS